MPFEAMRYEKDIEYPAAMLHKRNGSIFVFISEYDYIVVRETKRLSFIPLDELHPANECWIPVVAAYPYSANQFKDIGRQYAELIKERDSCRRTVDMQAEEIKELKDEIEDLKNNPPVWVTAQRMAGIVCGLARQKRFKLLSIARNRKR